MKLLSTYTYYDSKISNAATLVWLSALAFATRTAPVLYSKSLRYKLETFAVLPQERFYIYHNRNEDMRTS